MSGADLLDGRHVKMLSIRRIRDYCVGLQLLWIYCTVIQYM